MAADTLAQFIRQIDAGNRLGAGALAEKIVEWMATQAPAPAHGDSLAIERDEQMDRDYIPLPGGWELQTKGKGSTLRLLDKKTGERNPLPLPDFIVEFIERMAREVNAASNVQPKGTVPGWVIEAMQEALSVCDSVSMSRDRRVVRDGCVLYLQTEEWCQWAEQEVAPKMRAALAAVQHAAEATAQAPAPAPEGEPLFLLHCGQIDSSGEQDDWDIEADSGKRVEEFCRLHPDQTVKLYPHVQAPAVQHGKEQP